MTRRPCHQWLPPARRRHLHCCCCPIVGLEVNWLPLSEVMAVGKLNLATQLLMRASTQVSVSMVAKGMASSHLLDRSMMVNRYR